MLWGALTLVAAVLGVARLATGSSPVGVGGDRPGHPLTLGGLLVCFQHVSLALPQSF